MVAPPIRHRRRGTPPFLALLGCLSVMVVGQPAIAAVPSTPAPGLTVQADDVAVPTRYWSESGSPAVTAIRITNPGVRAETIRGNVTFPAGVSLIELFGQQGCSAAAAGTGGAVFTCAFVPEGGPGQLTARVTVEADAWRATPLIGQVNARSGTGTASDQFAIVLPPGPPAAALQLAAPDLILSGDPSGRTTTATLTVTASPTSAGPIPVDTYLEVVAPSGTDVVAFPSACIRYRRLGPGRHRCRLGRLPPGPARLAFGIRVPARAGAELPLTGAVRVLPGGQGPAEVQAGYQIRPAGSEPLSPSADPGRASDPAFTPDPELNTTDSGPDARGGSVTDTAPSRRLSAGVIVGGVVGFNALLGILVFVSLRHRTRVDVDLLRK